MYKHTLSTASSVYNLATTTAVQPLSYLSRGLNVPTGDPNLGDQIVAIDAVAAATGAAGTIALILVDPNVTDTKLRIIEATVTPTLYRTVSDGGSGGYVCTVSFPDLTNKVDLIGMLKSAPISVSPLDVQTPAVNPLRWYVGCSSLGGLSSLTVCVSLVRAN